MDERIECLLDKVTHVTAADVQRTPAHLSPLHEMVLVTVLGMRLRRRPPTCVTIIDCVNRSIPLPSIPLTVVVARP